MIKANTQTATLYNESAKSEVSPRKLKTYDSENVGSDPQFNVEGDYAVITGFNGKTTTQRPGPSAYIGKAVKSSQQFSPRASGNYGFEVSVNKKQNPGSGIYLESALANLHQKNESNNASNGQIADFMQPKR